MIGFPRLSPRAHSGGLAFTLGLVTLWAGASEVGKAKRKEFDRLSACGQCRYFWEGVGLGRVLPPKTLETLASFEARRELEADEIRLILRHSSLVRVHLGGPGVDEETIRGLCACRSLQEVALNSEKLIDEVVAPLLELPDLKRVSLNSSKIGEATIRRLARNPSLTAVGTSFSSTGGDVVALLKACPRLKELKINTVQLDSTLAKELPNFPALDDLTITFDRKANPAPVPVLPRLAWFGVYCEKSSPSDKWLIESLAHVPQITQLWCHIDVLSPEVADAMARLPKAYMQIEDTKWSSKPVPGIERLLDNVGRKRLRGSRLPPAPVP